ncbi:hypothetical protein [Spirosoma sordidisoli]|uniref:Uncharacterized protein n=1 Tax=Spirosoma sordidisoli TaxID=2502893 RepID=A0A4Q2UMT2_9BACT|nr:hypothetical protein [Spirosoma sordidisoli]RYC70092.1 hypothetical protein EQG79_09480 [Spirosoma sordidisoli]
MFSKVLSAVALVAIGVFSLVACTQDARVPAPQSVHFQPVSQADDEFEGDEIVDDTEAGARVAAIDTANQYKLKFTVTSACVSGTASVGFRYCEGAISSPSLSGTAINTKAGFKSFSVKRDKLNTTLYKTFDKTKSYTVYIMTAAAQKAVKAVKDANGAVVTPAVSAVPAVYSRLGVLDANPVAEKALNKAGTKRIGRPITTSTTTWTCPN